MLNVSKNGNRYSDEFKQQIVDLYRTGISVKQLSSEYGVSNVTSYKWIKDLSPVKISDNETVSAKQYKEMQKRIAQLELENEILKKATAIFAKKH